MSEAQELERAFRRLMAQVEKAKTRLFVNDCQGAYDILKEAQGEAAAVLPDEILDLTGDEG